MMKSLNALSAELLGTFWLVLGGCGSAVLAAKGIGSAWRFSWLLASRS
jgi:aquaporin Z